MNGQQGSDVVPGTGRDTLTAEGRGGFFGKSCGMYVEVSRGGLRMDG